jgi:hypothetical protein
VRPLLLCAYNAITPPRFSTVTLLASCGADLRVRPEAILQHGPSSRAQDAPQAQWAEGVPRTATSSAVSAWTPAASLWRRRASAVIAQLATLIFAETKIEHCGEDFSTDEKPCQNNGEREPYTIPASSFPICPIRGCFCCACNDSLLVRMAPFRDIKCPNVADELCRNTLLTLGRAFCKIRCASPEPYHPRPLPHDGTTTCNRGRGGKNTRIRGTPPNPRGVAHHWEKSDPRGSCPLPAAFA